MMVAVLSCEEQVYFCSARSKMFIVRATPHMALLWERYVVVGEAINMLLLRSKE